MASILRIVAGSYESRLFGFDCTADTDSTELSLALEPVFAYTPHNGCIKTVALSHPPMYLSSAGTDEQIKLYDLKRKRELGELLMQHEGTITKLQFFKKTHMISTGQDGQICIWRVKDWECYKVLRGHKGEVNDLAMHNTGRLMLSVGKDKHMRLWNLVKGRCAYITKLPEEATHVVWSPTGNHYSVCGDTTLYIYKAADASQLAIVKLGTRVHSIEFLSDEHIAVGLETGEVRILDVSNGETIANTQAHVRRIKSLRAVPSPFKPKSSLLVTACSEGDIKVWSVSPSQKNDQITCVASISTNCRLTCLDVTSLVNEIEYEADEDAENGSEADTVNEGEDESESGGGDIQDGEWEHADSSNDDDSDSIDENVVVATMNKNKRKPETTSISPQQKKTAARQKCSKSMSKDVPPPTNGCGDMSCGDGGCGAGLRIKKRVKTSKSKAAWVTTPISSTSTSSSGDMKNKGTGKKVKKQ
eukprot:CFRG5620T1